MTDLGTCPDCPHAWGQHSMPSAVQNRVVAGETVEPMITCPFCNCMNVTLPPAYAEVLRKFTPEEVLDELPAEAAQWKKLWQDDHRAAVDALAARDAAVTELALARSYKSLPDGYVWQDYYSPEDVLKIRGPLDEKLEAIGELHSVMSGERPGVVSGSAFAEGMDYVLDELAPFIPGAGK